MNPFYVEWVRTSAEAIFVFTCVLACFLMLGTGFSASINATSKTIKTVVVSFFILWMTGNALIILSSIPVNVTPGQYEAQLPE